MPQHVQDRDGYGEPPQGLQAFWTFPSQRFIGVRHRLVHRRVGLPQHNRVPAGFQLKRLMPYRPSRIAPIQRDLERCREGGPTQSEMQVVTSLAGMAIAAVHLGDQSPAIS